MLYTLNLHNVIGQLYLNEAGGEKREESLTKTKSVPLGTYTLKMP